MLFYNETEFQDTPIGQAPKDWQVLKLGDDEICEDIFYGITAKATEQNTGLRMLRTTDIKNYSADWDKLPFCEVTENRSALDKYILKRGDIIIARAGTVGVSVLVNRDFTDVIFGSYLIKVRLKSSIIPEFAHYFLQSNLYWKHIQKAQGST
jgi:type I restriction enzyme S subunit